MRRTLLLGLILLVGSPAWAQDLDRLVERANLYWGELSKGDKVKAAQYVEAASRKEAIMYDGVKEPRVESLSLTGDKSKVLVSIRTKMFLPEVQQEVRQTLTETWIFANGNWFMKPEGGSPFTGHSDSKPTAKTVPFTFELLDRKIDLGRHQQGEMVKGSLRFKAPRDPVENIRGKGIPGFRVTGIQWTDDSSGVVNFVVDTTLLADNVAGEVTIEALGKLNAELAYPVKSDKASFTMQIQGTVRIAQLPQTDAAKKEAMVEVEVRNVGNSPFTITRVYHPVSLSFYAVDRIQTPIQPGQAVTLPFHYVNKLAPPDDAELTLKFLPGVVTNDTIIFRLSGGKSEINAETGLTREQMDTRQQIQEAQRKIQQDLDRQKQQSK